MDSCGHDINRLRENYENRKNKSIFRILLKQLFPHQF